MPHAGPHPQQAYAAPTGVVLRMLGSHGRLSAILSLPPSPFPTHLTLVGPPPCARREPAQRRGRSSIRPETSRSRTFGEKGTSMSQFYSKFLAPIQFAPAPAVWQGRNLSFLMKEQYDAAFDAQLAAARPRSLTEARALGGWGGSGGSDSPVRISYSSAAELKRMSHELGIMEDLKAGVPRTGYRGVVHLRIGGTPVLLAPTFKVDQDITKPLSERP